MTDMYKARRADLDAELASVMAAMAEAREAKNLEAENAALDRALEITDEIKRVGEERLAVLVDVAATLGILTVH